MLIIDLYLRMIGTEVALCAGLRLPGLSHRESVPRVTDAAASKRAVGVFPYMFQGLWSMRRISDCPGEIPACVVFAEMFSILALCAAADVIDLALIGTVGWFSGRPVETPKPLYGNVILLGEWFPGFHVFLHEAVDYGNGGHSNGRYQDKKQNFDKEHEAKGAGEELLPGIDPCPCQIASRQRKGDHAGDAEDPFMLWYVADETAWLHEEVDVEDCSKEDDSSEQMQISDDEPECFMKGYTEESSCIYFLISP